MCCGYLNHFDDFLVNCELSTRRDLLESRGEYIIFSSGPLTTA
jgi:hypothetical protein